ncbi:type VII secretion-associated serine protease mycosin [Plantactinospora sp. GCM10030261]|uniref:type VII secretion-associated serine protease mycosin n=1 Tax=Plantactinospora sp. GCM10030261 TaxID=3273420 RepID=UPI0036147403
MILLRSLAAVLAAGLLGQLTVPAGIVLSGDDPSRSGIGAPESGCGAQPAAQPAPAGTPWTQRRYPPEQLAALATGAGVTVAVIDSGVQASHPQLAGRVDVGADFLDHGRDGWQDCVGHGTAVASIIAAAPRPDTPVRGLAPDARILPIRVSEQQVIDGRETGRPADPQQLAHAIRWSVEQGATVINLSVVLYRDVPSIRTAVAFAVARDVVVVAAAGNRRDSGDPRPYPAAYPGVLGVGAIGRDGKRSEFSQTGPHVDLMAPGAGVPVASLAGATQERDGTSYAAPFVAATAALIRQYRPRSTAAEVAVQILDNVDPAPDAGAGHGRGVLNPFRAVTGTTGTGPAGPVAALPARPVDPSLAVQESRRNESGHAAMMIGALAAGLAVLVLTTAAVLPHGVRRRWSPGSPDLGRPR